MEDAEVKQEFKLTDARVKKAPPGEHRDGVNGLVLRVTPRGKRVWFVRYRSPTQFKTMVVGGNEYRVGRDRRYPLGTYDAVSLKAARDKAKAESVRIAKGIDPMEEKQAEKYTASVRELFEKWSEGHAAKKATGADMVRVLRREVPRSWWSKPAKSVTTPEVTRVLDGIVVDRPYQANKTRAYLSSMFVYGVQRGMVDVNPVSSTKLPHTPEDREGDPLTAKQIRKLWAVLTREDPIIAATYRLRLLTLQRGRQIRMMKWADVELTEDGIGEWWAAPAKTTKTKKANRVYLNALARRELERLRPLTGKSEYVLRSPRQKEDLPIGQLQKASVRIRDAAKLPAEFARGFRRTGRTWLASTGEVSPDACERVLGHSVKGVRSAYDDWDYGPEKKHAMTLWGDRVEEILLRRRPAPGKALKFPEKRHG